MGLRRLARQMTAGRRKAALAVGYAAYVERERVMGRKPVSKRDWRLEIEHGMVGGGRGAGRAGGGDGGDTVELAEPGGGTVEMTGDDFA